MGGDTAAAAPRSSIADVATAEEGQHLIRVSLPDNQGTVVCVHGSVTLMDALQPALARRRLNASDYMPCFFGTAQKAGWQTPVSALPSYHIVLAAIPRHMHGSIRKKINWADEGGAEGEGATAVVAVKSHTRSTAAARRLSVVASAAVFEAIDEQAAGGTGTSPPAPSDALAPSADAAPQAATAAIDKRTRIVNELVATERAFVSSMDYLVATYCVPLRSTPGILLGEDARVIFGNVDELVEGNRQLLVRMEEVLAKWDTATSRVGPLFKSMEPFFTLYENYCNNHAAATAALLRCQERESFAFFLRDVQRSATAAASAAAAGAAQRGDGVAGAAHQSLDSLLLMPVQRVPRYILMLQELLKHTPETHPDRDDIAAALEEVRRLAESLNENVRRAENEAYVAAIERAFPMDSLALTTSPPLSTWTGAAAVVSQSPSGGHVQAAQQQQMRSSRTMSDSAASSSSSAREAASRVRQSRATTMLGIPETPPPVSPTTQRASVFEFPSPSASTSSPSPSPQPPVAAKCTRRFIMEGMLRVSGDDGSVRDRYVFLLSDQLLIAKPRSAANVSIERGAQFNIKARVALHEAWVAGADDFGDPESFLVGWGGRVTYLGVGSQIERDTWLEAVAGRIAAEKQADPNGRGPLMVHREESSGQHAQTAQRGFSLSKGFYATTADDVNAVMRAALDKFGIVGDPAWYGLWEVYDPPNGYPRSRILLPYECPLILRYALVAMGRHEHTRLVMREYDASALARTDMQRHLAREPRDQRSASVGSRPVSQRLSSSSVKPLLGTLSAAWSSGGSRTSIFSDAAPPSRLSGGTIASFARRSTKRAPSRPQRQGSTASARSEKLYTGRPVEALVASVSDASSHRPSVVSHRGSDASTASGYSVTSASSAVPPDATESPVTAAGTVRLTLVAPIRDLLQHLYDSGQGRRALFRPAPISRLGADLLDAFDFGLHVEMSDVPVNVAASMVVELLSKMPDSLVPVRAWFPYAPQLLAAAKSRASWGGSGRRGSQGSASANPALPLVKSVVEALSDAGRLVFGSLCGVLARLAAGSDGLAPDTAADRLYAAIVGLPSGENGFTSTLTFAELGIAAAALVECAIVEAVRLFGADVLEGPRRLSQLPSMRESMDEGMSTPSAPSTPLPTASTPLTTPAVAATRSLTDVPVSSPAIAATRALPAVPSHVIAPQSEMEAPVASSAAHVDEEGRVFTFDSSFVGELRETTI